MADAVILAGGVAKGAFGAGVLSVLASEGALDVRRVVATSSGALNGVFYASALRRGDACDAGSALADLWIEQGTVGNAFDVNIRGAASLEGISSNAKLLDLLRRHVRPTCGGRPIDFRLVVTAVSGALDSGAVPPATTFERVLCFDGDAFDGGARFEYMLHAVTASAAFPLAYLPVTLTIGGAEVECYDGGLVNNAPIAHALGDRDVSRIFVIAPYPRRTEARPADAHGLGLLAHLGDVLVNERLHRDVREARSVNAALAALGARLPARMRDRALDALGWRGRRTVEIVELRPPAPLDGGPFDGFFSRALRGAYVTAGEEAALTWVATRAG